MQRGCLEISDWNSPDQFQPLGFRKTPHCRSFTLLTPRVAVDKSALKEPWNPQLPPRNRVQGKKTDRYSKEIRLASTDLVQPFSIIWLWIARISNLQQNNLCGIWQNPELETS